MFIIGTQFCQAFSTKLLNTETKPMRNVLK